MSDARKISINTSTFPLSGGVNHRGGRGGTRATGPPLFLPLSGLGAQVRILCVMRPDYGSRGHRKLWASVPMPAVFTVCLLLSGKRFEGSWCLQKTRMLRMCANLCPAAGRSQTPCVWALSSPRQASCERACFPGEPQRGQGDASGEVGLASGQGSGARSATPTLHL